MKDGKIESFKDLTVWQEGHKLVLMVYSETKNFPREELYSLIDQVRRAVTSITANIAEGFGRQTIREKIQFYYQAKGSLTELQNFMLIAKDVGYLNEKKYIEVEEQINLVGRLLQGLIKKSRSFIIQKSTI